VAEAEAGAARRELWIKHAGSEPMPRGASAPSDAEKDGPDEPLVASPQVVSTDNRNLQSFELLDPCYALHFETGGLPCFN
jgi:hypothetical protein